MSGGDPLRRSFALPPGQLTQCGHRKPIRLWDGDYADFAHRI
jgi:hypothetical protein